MVTAWIPAQPVPVAMGPLAFAKPLGVFELVKDIEFNKFDTSYDRRVAEAFKAGNVAVEDGAFDIGEVSFHHNRSFHTAARNRTRQSRVVLASTYFADGATDTRSTNNGVGRLGEIHPRRRAGRRGGKRDEPGVLAVWRAKKMSDTFQRSCEHWSEESRL